MGQYVTFLLNLAAETDDRTIADSLAFRPSDVAMPKTAFEWKVICDAADKVFVIARATSGGYEVIATATRGLFGLDDKKQLEDETVPTSHQWSVVARALEVNVAKAAVVPADPTVLDVDDVVRSYKGKRHARLVDPPPELPSNIVAPVKRTPSARPAGRRIVLGLGAGALAVVLAGMIIVKRAKKSSPPPPRPAPTPVVAAPIAPPIAIDASRGPSTLREALERGDDELLTYASARMRWADVSGSSDTSVGYILKDWQSERGKKLCVEGTIATIERRDVGSRKTFAGELRTDDGDVVTFTAVGSTGDLVRRSRGKLCGVVTGKVALVGMFELPENQSPVVEQ